MFNNTVTVDTRDYDVLISNSVKLGLIAEYLKDNENDWSAVDYIRNILNIKKAERKEVE